jgi:hypothetical protein
MGEGNWSELSCGDEAGTAASYLACASPKGWTLEDPVMSADAVQRHGPAGPGATFGQAYVADEITVRMRTIQTENDAGGDQTGQLVYELYGGYTATTVNTLVKTFAGSAASQLAAADGDANFYVLHTQTSVPSGSNYYFKLRAYNRAGKYSGYSDPNDVTFGLHEVGRVPDPPATCYAEQHIAQSLVGGVMIATVKVYWTVPANNGGVQILTGADGTTAAGYKISVVNDASTFYSSGSTPDPSGSNGLAGFAAGYVFTAYDYEYAISVRANIFQVITIQAQNILGYGPVCTIGDGTSTVMTHN